MLQAIKQHLTVVSCGQTLSMCGTAVVKVSRQNDSGIGVLEAQAKGAGVCVSFE